MSSKVASKKGKEPKKPMTSYFFWLEANRREVKKQFPHAKKSFAKRAGGMWKKLEDKSHWETQARKAKKEYEKALDEFEKGAKVTNNNKRKQPEKKKEQNGKKTKKDGSEASTDED